MKESKHLGSRDMRELGNRAKTTLNYVILDKGEYFVDFLGTGCPIWSTAADARREFSSRADARRVGDVLNKVYKLTSRVIDMSKPGNKKLYTREVPPEMRLQY